MSETVSSTLLPPLPERMRPRTLDQYVGQRHLVGSGSVVFHEQAVEFVERFVLVGRDVHTQEPFVLAAPHSQQPM